PKAVAALQAITPPASLQKAWASACLSCAESLPKSEAGRIYRRIFDGPYDIVSRAAALAGLVRTGQMKAGELVAVLKGKEPQLQVAAAQLSSELREKAAVQGYVAALPALPAHLQVIVISGFAASKNRAAATAAAALAESADAEVVTAALRALGEIGDASHVPMLMRLALGKDERAALAFASLTRLPGAAVDAALAKSLRSSDARERVRAIEAFAARMDRRQNKAILAACKDADKDVRIAAYKALRSLADDSMLPALADLLIATDSGAERGELEQTVTATALRAASADAAAEVLIARLGRSVETDAILLGVLAKRGGSKALAEVRRRVGSNDPEQRKAAVRAMSAWADTAPLGDLMNVAQNDPDAACRTLALRGYVRLVADSNLSVDEKVKMFQSALEAAKQPDAIKQILAGLGGLKELASLKVVMGQLDNAAVASEAAAAALSISQELVTRRKLRDKAVADALMQIQKNQTVSEAQRKQAASLLKRMSQSESKSK
ncbi:MAG: HEAT repeat domain-containing protein, partial [Verrucomicrobiae bacterium]|nr:HEAT repeat domain-containing protein [Verrucomicrobiae bacterium]